MSNFQSPHSAYIHIPFCRRRCFYCDFPISVVGDRPSHGTLGWMEEYSEFLCREINAAPKFQENLETVFFGGGTPSLLPIPLLEKILATLDSHLGIATGAEISLEIDPGTFDLLQVQQYYHLGVNRLSLGVQAFQDDLLKLSGRSHTTNDIFAAVEMVRQGGISNLSLDLISGLPHQTPQHWQDSLQQAINLAPEHLSCYDLVLEPVTAFGKQYQPGEKPLPEDETTANMYRQAQKILTQAGYGHYEISNYARQGYQCRHNRVYWENRSYYGFGMGAASYVNGQRFNRPRTRAEYYDWVEKGAVVDSLPLDWEDILLEKLMLGLRLAEGVSLGEIKEEFGEEIVEKILVCLKPYFQEGWVDFGSGETGNLRLTDPEGFLFSNTVLADLFNCL